MIDWAATGAMLQGVGTLVGGLAVIGAAIIGSRTFDNWKRQKLAERHIEQAERILTATYKVRRDLAMVRSPAMWAYELEAGEARLKELGQWDSIVGGEQERSRLRTTQAYYNRIASTRDDQIALEECQPMARALFGMGLEAALEKLNHQQIRGGSYNPKRQSRFKAYRPSTFRNNASAAAVSASCFDAPSPSALA